MIRSIMIPLDGSAFGEYALSLGLGIARRAGARVRMVHVCEPPPRGRFFEGAPRTDPAADQARAGRYLSQMAAFLSAEWEVPITTAVLHGSPAETLRAEAEARQVDLVVMTSHGYGPLTRLWLGSVAHALARTLPMPLLITRPRAESTDLLEHVAEPALQRVLLPLDGSPLGEAALEPALALGGLMGAQYTLVQAIDPPVLGYAPAAYVGGLDQQVLEQMRAAGQEYLDKAAARLRAQGAQVATNLLVGPPALAVVSYAREHAFDLIAMATHGRSGAARLLLGSVAEQVLQGTSLPVLMYRPGSAA